MSRTDDEMLEELIRHRRSLTRWLAVRLLEYSQAHQLLDTAGILEGVGGDLLSLPDRIQLLLDQRYRKE